MIIPRTPDADIWKWPLEKMPAEIVAAYQKCKKYFFLDDMTNAVAAELGVDERAYDDRKQLRFWVYAIRRAYNTLAAQRVGRGLEKHGWTPIQEAKGKVWMGTERLQLCRVSFDDGHARVALVHVKFAADGELWFAPPRKRKGRYPLSRLINDDSGLTYYRRAR